MAAAVGGRDPAHHARPLAAEAGRADRREERRLDGHRQARPDAAPGARARARSCPQEIRYISAATDGRVERLVILPGAPVKPDSILLEMSNPELERDALDAESQLRAAQAELVNVRAQAERGRSWTSRPRPRPSRSDFHQARAPGRDERGPLQGGPRRRPDAQALEGPRRGARDAQRDRGEAPRQRRGRRRRPRSPSRRRTVEQLRALAAAEAVADGSAPRARRHRRRPAGAAASRSASASRPGTTLAKVAEPTKLKAQLKIAETQAKDVADRPAGLDRHAQRHRRREGLAHRPGRAERHGHRRRRARGRAAQGRAARPLGRRHDRARPAGGRPLRRPAGVRAGEEPGRPLPRRTRTATRPMRVKVRLGKSSVNTVEILEGLKPGDKVILSDMSAWDAYDRVRLK